MLHIWKYVPSCEEPEESAYTWYSDLGCHIFLRIRSPDHRRCHRREDKGEPNHKYCQHSAILRDRPYNTGETDHHEECRDKFCYHELPHAFHRFLHFFCIEAIFAMMDTHPEFTKKWTMPYRTECKTSNRHNRDSHPWESSHKKKIKM